MGLFLREYTKKAVNIGRNNDFGSGLFHGVAICFGGLYPKKKQGWEEIS